MSGPDPLRMRGMAEPPVPKTPVGRFAPYPVWMTLRLMTMAAGALAVVWVGFAFYALIQYTSGGDRDATVLPVWVFVVAVIVGAQPRHWRGNLPPFGELLGAPLASKQCPACAQSIFDHMPPSGYEPDDTRRSWWPSRHCTGCGHDLMQRTAETGKTQ